MSEILYQKYRPQTLGEVFYQDHITITLESQIKQDKIASAYLFAGPRGTGKTSVARILAQALQVGQLDLVEIDAASNRGIDDIRQLRTQVYLVPSSGSKKFYILDEAHMLTNEAANALLKTLEEPPSHVHFVLCTTAPYKLPPTILSRCQRFDFNVPPPEVLAKFVAKMAAKEKIKLDPASINLIAKQAQGSFRDALVILEKIQAHIGRTAKVSHEKVKTILGWVGEEFMEKFVQRVKDGQVRSFLQDLATAQKQGIDLSFLLQLLIERLHEELLQIDIEAPTEQAAAQKLLGLSRRLWEAQRELKEAADPLLPLQMALVAWYLDQQEAKESIHNPGSSLAPLAKKASGASFHKLNLEEVKKRWPEVLQKIKPYNSGVEILLRNSQPHQLQDEELVLLVEYAFHQEKLQESKNRRLLEEVVSQVFEHPLKIVCLTEGRQLMGEANGKAFEQKAPSVENDLIKLAQQVFGGEVIE